MQEHVELTSYQAVERAAHEANRAAVNGPNYGRVNAETAKAWAMIADVLLKIEQSR